MQGNLTDVRAEGSRTVVILSMDIVGDRASDRDEAGAGSDWKEPSLREKHIDDVREADTAFAAKYAGRFVEGQEAIEAPAVDEFAPGVETGVAVTASEAIGKQGARHGGLKDLRQLIVPCRFVDV